MFNLSAFNFDEFKKIAMRGLILSVLFLEITKANDTTITNIILFTSFYIIMVYGAILTNVDQNAITSAFLTKTVFSLIEDRIKLS
jgi:hypothetical protein